MPIPGAAIPFQYSPLSFPFIAINVYINKSKPLRFVIDTGTGFPLVLDRKILQHLNLPGQHPAWAQINSTTTQITLVKPIRDLRLTPNHSSSERMPTFSQVPAIAMDMPTVAFAGMTKGKKIAGIIGNSFFRFLPTGYAFQLDFTHKQMRICRVPAKISGDVIVLPLSLRSSPAGNQKDYVYGTLYNTRFTLVSGETKQFTVDTGLPSSSLSASDLLLNGRPTAKNLENWGGTRGIEDDNDLMDAVLVTLKQGRLSLPDTTLETVYPPYDSSLGLDVLSRFTVTLDLARSRLILQRPPHILPPQIPGATDALIGRRGTNYVVLSVAPASPAASAGIRPADRVITIDSHTLADLSPFVAQRLLDGFALTRAEVEVMHGNVSAHATYRRRSLFGGHDVTQGIAFLLMGQKATGEVLAVNAVASGSLAEKAGLAIGDQVTDLNGQSVSSLSAGQILTDLNAPQVALTVRRQGVADPLHFQFPVNAPSSPTMPP